MSGEILCGGSRLASAAPVKANRNGLPSSDSGVVRQASSLFVGQIRATLAHIFIGSLRPTEAEYGISVFLWAKTLYVSGSDSPRRRRVVPRKSAVVQRRDAYLCPTL